MSSDSRVPNTRNKVRTLVLGSWGLFGAGHCGVLKRLEELGKLKDFSALVGSGSGCIVLGLLACGIPLAEISQLCMSLSKEIQVSAMNIFSGYLLDRKKVSDALTALITKYCGKIPTLSELYDTTKVLLVFSLYNLSTQTHVRMRYSNYPTTPIIDAILAATTIPFVYTSYSMNNMCYSDSTLCNPYPTDVVKHGEGIAVAFSLIPTSSTQDSIICLANYMCSSIGSLQAKNRQNQNYTHITVPVRSILGSAEDYQAAYGLTVDLLNA